jgi:nicotinate-nucleotide adenylyltransferase
LSGGGRPRPIGIFGGTFDPVHYGHLRPALELYQDLGLDHVRFIPAAHPPHREAPRVSPGKRLALLRMAVAGEPALRVDDRELRRPGPSFMVDTLESLRRDLAPAPLCLLLGEDAFLGLPGWHRWGEILGLAHLVVATRPGSMQVRDARLTTLLAEHRVDDPNLLMQSTAGCVLVHSVTPLGISATAIRGLLKMGLSARFLLPDEVLEAVLVQGLYGSGVDSP